MSDQAKYAIGIDLGTTNCVISAIDLATAKGSYPEIITIPVRQRVDEESVAELNKLASFLYYPTETQKESLPEFNHDSEGWILGGAAQVMGRKVSGRLVTSAKSWLCHGRVDKRSNILPQGGSEDVPKISPLKATELILKHLRFAWEESEYGENAPIEEQILTVTLPASFDQVARELTLEACKLAGMGHAKMLEEPQAAFYNWISLRKGRWEEALGSARHVLICDVGGGTSDFSLVDCFEEEGEFKFNRVAVGEHLLLGGDNMDLGLAHLAENKISGSKKKLNQSQWLLLSQLTRHSKENLLSENGDEEVTIRLPGSGTKVIGGLRQTSLKKDEVEGMILDGFYADIDFKTYESRKGSGIKELGLPYEQEPTITWHILDFVHRHLDQGQYPDAILFNGGSLEPKSIRNRIHSSLSKHGPESQEIKILESDSLAEAVSRGAAFYGFSVNRGGVRIGGGVPVAYYLGIQGGEQSQQLCVIPKGTEAHESVKVDIEGLEVRTNTPVHFPLYQSDAYALDESGKIRHLEGASNGSLNTLVKFGKAEEKMVPVIIEGEVTELDTLNLSLKSKHTDHVWKLEFDLRSTNEDVSREGYKEQDVVETLNIDPDWFKQTLESSAAGVIKSIEKQYDAKRSDFHIPTLRGIADELLKYDQHPRKNAKEETRWLNALSYAMRPGFGHGSDDLRRSKIWSLFKRGPLSGKDTSVWVEWALLWRRMAPGLEPGRQNDLYQRNKKNLIDKKGLVNLKGENAEMWRMIGCLEFIPVKDKVKLGNAVLESLKQENVKQVDLLLWLLSRLGARSPLQVGVDGILASKDIECWLDTLMKLNALDSKKVLTTFIECTRMTGERTIDVSNEFRSKVLAWIEDNVPNLEEDFIKPIKEIQKRAIEEQVQMVGESLPVGLQLQL